MPPGGTTAAAFVREEEAASRGWGTLLCVRPALNWRRGSGRLVDRRLHPVPCRTSGLGGACRAPPNTHVRAYIVPGQGGRAAAFPAQGAAHAGTVAVAWGAAAVPLGSTTSSRSCRCRRADIDRSA